MTNRIALALILLAAAPAAQARDIAGQMTYRERIALDPAAVLVVALSGPEGVVAEARVPAEGRQVPLAFALSAPDGAAYQVQGALVLDGRPAWLSEMVAVPAGTGAVDLGLVQMTTGGVIGLSTRFDCGGTGVAIGFIDQVARMQVGDAVFAMTQATSGSGARYTDGATPETVFWGKGTTATVTVRGQDLPGCTLVTAPGPKPLTARGNEPFWRLDLTAEGYAFTANIGADPRSGPLPAPEAVTGGERLALAEDLSVTLTRDICRDSMSGMPFPMTATVTDKDAVLTGCAGDPADLLAGDWTVTDIGPMALPKDAGVTIAFDTAGAAVSGSGGCNRFNAGFALTGEGLGFSPAASTMMACPEDQMAREQAFHAALARVTRFDIAADGALSLIAGDTPAIRATR